MATRRFICVNYFRRISNVPTAAPGAACHIARGSELKAETEGADSPARIHASPVGANANGELNASASTGLPVDAQDWATKLARFLLPPAPPPGKDGCCF